MDNNDFLIEKLKESEYSENQIELIINGLSEEKLTTFRINNINCIDKAKLLETLNNLKIEFQESKIIKDAYILKNCKAKDGFDSKTGLKYDNFSFYKDGEIYVQSLSSMLPVIILNPNINENILDMCAAPGSKTTMIGSICNNKVNITAVEIHKDRFEKLKYNLSKQSVNAIVFNMNALDLDDMFKFDKILLDAPCSGSGTLDITNNKYKKYFTNELIKKCVNTQKKLLKKAYKLLRSGGKLIYSTCSLLKAENEDIVNYATENGFKIDFCKIDCDKKDLSPGSSVNDNVYMKIFPDKYFEGFFVAKLIKQ